MNSVITIYSKHMNLFFLVKFKFNSIIEFNYNIYVYKKPPLKK
jgi:hypothetical protein